MLQSSGTARFALASEGTVGVGQVVVARVGAAWSDVAFKTDDGGSNSSPAAPDIPGAALGIWACDDWPAYNGSASDCTRWDWSVMRGQYITTPYNPGSSPVFALAKAHNTHLIHTPIGATVEELIPKLPSAAARAKFVAAEAAAVTHLGGGPWSGSVLDFEAIPRKCVNTTPGVDNPCVAGFSQLTRELRAAMPGKLVTAAMPYVAFTVVRLVCVPQPPLCLKEMGTCWSSAATPLWMATSTMRR